MATEYIGGDFNSASPAHTAAKALIHEENVHSHGDESDIARLTLDLKDNRKAQAALATRLAEAAAQRNDTWKFTAYLETLMKGDWPADEGQRNGLVHSQIAMPAVKLLSLSKGNTTAALDAIIATLHVNLQKVAIDRMLRAAAHQGEYDAVRALLAAGADATADGSRALLNAVFADKLDCARALRDHGADLAAMRETAQMLKYDGEKTHKLGLQMAKLAASSARAEDYYYACIENTPNGYKDRFDARDRAVALFKIGQPEALQQFLRGYLAFKRPSERSRKADEGYEGNIVTPLMALLQIADEPAQDLALALDALPMRDRQTATQLLLRHISAKGMSPLIADAVIANGGEVGIFGNMPLSLAVRNGHSDLALHLVREHGANIGEAVMDGQLNGVAAEGLQKLYTFMATQVAPQLGQAAPVRFAKPSPIVRKP